MIKRWMIPILSVIFFYSGSSYCEPLLSQEKLFENIIVSINKDPHLWFSTGTYLIYAESIDDVKMLKEKTFPSISDVAKVVISFNFGSPKTDYDYVRIEKPFLSGFIRDKAGDKLMDQIKIFIYNELKKEVGHFVKIPESEPPPNKAPENKDEPEKL